jgi:hypothetical protein
MIDHEQPFKTHPDVVVTELDGENESVLLHLGTKKYYTLNETGVRIWQLLGDGCAVGEITHKICAEYDVSSASAEKSVSELIRSLLEEELLSRG